MSISTFDLNRHHFLGTAVTAGTSAAFGATLAVNEAIADARGNTKRLPPYTSAVPEMDVILTPRARLSSSWGQSGDDRGFSPCLGAAN
jgi:hypothetical protein